MGWKVILAVVRLSQPLAAYGSRQELESPAIIRRMFRLQSESRFRPKLNFGMEMRVDDGGKVLEQICTIVTASIYKKWGCAVDATSHPS